MNTVYTGVNCQPCQNLKKWMTNNGFEFVELDAIDHIDVVRSYGKTSVPLLVTDKGHHYGFQLTDREKLTEMLS